MNENNNIPDNMNEDPIVEEPVIEAPAEETPKTDGQTSNIEYRWNYSEELKHSKKSRSNGGVLTFAIIMTIAFCLCFITLLGVVLYEGSELMVPTRTIFVREDDGLSGTLTIPEIANKVQPSTVTISVFYEDSNSMGIGTGIIMSEDGYIATNYHVVENGILIKIIRISGEEYTAELVGYDELSDLALLKVRANNLPAATFGDSDALVVGETVVSIGTPRNFDYMGSTTSGIISGINRDFKIYDNSGVMVKKMTFIQTDAVVNPGNSGGPLINDRGEIIGIVTMKLTNEYEGIGFAIPSNGALAILNEIKETGAATNNSSQVASKRALLGIYGGGIRIGDSYTRADGTIGVAEVDGVVVIELTPPDADAAKKLMVGDIITEMDGVVVDDIYDVMGITNNKRAGDKIRVTYYRDGAYNTVDIILASE